MDSNLFSHHAYYSLGGSGAVEPLISLLNKEGFQTTGNADFWMARLDTFGISESHKLKEMDSRQPLGDKKVFIISFDSITAEAQNALLKTFEEPSGRSFYFLCINKTEELLPTLRSRLLPLPLEFEKKEERKEAEDFLKMELDERMVFAHSFAEDIKKEKRNKKEAADFLNVLEEVAHEYYHIASPGLFRKFLEVKKFAGIQGWSVKTLLETVGAVLPTIK